MYDPKVGFKPLQSFIPLDSKEYNQQYLHWFSSLNCIPSSWVKILKSETTGIKYENLENYIAHNDCIVNVTSLSSQYLYNHIIETTATDPTHKPKLEIKLNGSLKWNNAFTILNKTTIDTGSREFQYRILHNYWHVNSKLYRWKLVDSPRCLYCFINTETMEHLFCECPVSVTLFMQIKTWRNNLGIKLPDMNYSNIIIGVLPCTGINMLINHIIMMFKQILFYNRDKSFTPTLSMFQIQLNQIERIEYKIAVKNGKTYNHLCKWSNYLQIQNS